MPVRDVSERRQGVVPDPTQLRGGGDECGVRTDPQHDEEQRGEQPSRSPHPERAEMDASIASPLGEEEAGDQEPRQDEEQVDTEVSTFEVPTVEQHDADDGRSA